MSKATEIIEAIPRDDFRKNFVRGLCRTLSFAGLYSFKAEHISKEEKDEVRAILNENGIPYELTENDEALDEIAAVVSARAVSLV